MRYFTKTPHCRGVDNAGAVGENCSYGWRLAYSELAVKQGQSLATWGSSRWPMMRALG